MWGWFRDYGMCFELEGRRQQAWRTPASLGLVNTGVMNVLPGNRWRPDAVLEASAWGPLSRSSKVSTS